MKRNIRMGRGRDLDLLLRRGRRISDALFSVVWRPGPGHRLVCIVPRAVDKRATVRNRLCRRIREFFHIHYQGIPSHLDIAVICRRGSATATRVQFYAALKEILFRLQ